MTMLLILNGSDEGTCAALRAREPMLAAILTHLPSLVSEAEPEKPVRRTSRTIPQFRDSKACCTQQ